MPDLLPHPFRVGSGAVDLVDEEGRRHLQPLQRPHQDAGLRLHAFDSGDDQDDRVEDAERTLHLGDEVGVPRSVNEIHTQVAGGERGDSCFYRNTAPALELHGVGRRGATVDTAEAVYFGRPRWSRSRVVAMNSAQHHSDR